MENTLENKAKFFAQYWSQSISRGDCSGWLYFRKHRLKKASIELTPLSQITDEDAIEVAKSCRYSGSDYTYSELLNIGHDLAKTIYRTDCPYSATKLIRTLDCVRRLGYAVEYDGLGVEKQVEYGWVKLID